MGTRIGHSTILVDDYKVVMNGLKVLLESHDIARVVGEAKTLLESTRLIARLQPDIVISDIQSKDNDVIQLMREAQSTSPNTKFVIFSRASNEENVLTAIQSGAKAYVLKDAPVNQIIEAIRQVIDGNYYLTPSLMHFAIECCLRNRQKDKNDSYEKLTYRERQILQLVSRGYSNSKIAEQLDISRRTVEIHRSNLVRKLNLKNQGDQLREYAIKQGILHEVDE